ncbi:hypothetical protein J19TS2_43840 [Cohnella xylanilytica]|uniref:Stage II sporulation protein P n=1 Tax=Cohnella xylanilytica TaxID=557555 RepID=A0A841U2M8_9BACL|nr:stage II sporulation protein P [Cohnella xylanilytica]MBB6692593.1 stage II sporulation protein P [Cohnella xylanilytica]GIO14829.1 hypothetical protein J19TS2_43840 [Cohnella xylanilytica]
MKRIVVLRAGKRSRIGIKRLLATGKAYLALSLCSMLVFLLLGLGGMLQNSLASSPVQSMRGFAASVSGTFFASLLGMELPHMEKQVEKSPFSAERMAAFLVRFLTDLNPDDPKSLLELGMPSVGRDSAVLLRPGSGGDAEAPEDRGPESVDEGSDGEEEPGAEPSPQASDGAGEEADPGDDPASEPPPSSSEPPAEETPPPPADGRDVVFIYHSHNRESWFPELKAGTKDPNSDKVNVTLVGKRMAEQLERLGVGAVHSDKDYAKTVKGYNWNYSYKYSLQTIKEAMKSHKDLKFFFDIHRDSQHRKKTTATIDGVSYAQVYFIIGHRNPDWEKNEAFANSIHQVLEKEYPGLSRGIWGKTAATGNGEYNQSVADDSVLIEIGGVDNTLAECYRTADALAKAVAGIIREGQGAVKANGAAEGAKSEAK